VLIYPYIKMNGGGGQGTTQGVFRCPSSRITATGTPHYTMSCDYNWGWKGYSYQGSANCLFEPMVDEVAGTIFITETPDCANAAAQGKMCAAQTHRACQPQYLHPEHWSETSTWPWHTDVSTNRSQERHVGGMNYVFFDGHAKWHRVEQTVRPRNLWTIRTND
jgi:prepilin-type processing-associated H-X9-DG protein